MSNLSASIKTNKDGSKYVLSPPPHIGNTAKLPLNVGAQQPHSVETKTSPSITTNEFGETSAVSANIHAYTHDCTVKLINNCTDVLTSSYESTRPPQYFEKEKQELFICNRRQ